MSFFEPRRPLRRAARGGKGRPPVPFPSLTNLRGRWRADQVTLVGSDIDTFIDMSGNDNTLTAVNRPALITGPNGRPAAQHVEGSTEYVQNASLNMGAAVSAMTQLWVIRVDVATASRRWSHYASQTVIMRHTSGGFAELIETGTGGATSTGTTDLRVGFRVVWATLDPTGNQSVGLDTTTQDTDANTLADPASSAGYTVGAGATGVAPSSISWAEHCILRSIITPTELAGFVAYARSRYGQAV